MTSFVHETLVGHGAAEGSEHGVVRGGARRRAIAHGRERAAPQAGRAVVIRLRYSQDDRRWRIGRWRKVGRYEVGRRREREQGLREGRRIGEKGGGRDAATLVSERVGAFCSVGELVSVRADEHVRLPGRETGVPSRRRA